MLMKLWNAMSRPWWLLLFIATCAWSADPQAGRAIFQQQCAVCHTAEPNDNGGAQGPSLIGVFGRRAASNPNFAYTDALRKSNLVWDASTLNRFLAAPTTVVPGTAMAIAVPDATDRENIIAYLESVKDARDASTSVTQPGEADWKNDKPGRVHKVQSPLPPPFATPSARNQPQLVPKPEGAHLDVPKGFSVSVFAQDLRGPRRMIVAANGDVLVSETRGGQVSTLRTAADGKSATATVFAEGLRQPFGIAFYPDAKRPQWLYVAETHRVVRYPYKTGDAKARGEAQVVIDELPSGGHFTRDIVFSADGKRMFLSVGSASNVAERMEKKSVQEAQAWESEHGLGAAWGNETNRAAVLVYSVDDFKQAKIFASGIRNCVSVAIQPKTHDLWCTTNERDLLGDDLVPDYSTRVQEGGFYGWPWYYIGANEDPRLRGERPDLADKVLVPDVLFQAHSAALHLTFYTATSGAAAFPREYVDDAFVAFHGSWNRSFRTGYKIVRVRMKNGAPTGEYEDFLTGFIVDNGDVWGRPVATAVLGDGSLLVSDDGDNQIYRVAYIR
jgi:glucose/arabinose dehydrogenase/cytochrome c2